MNQDIKNIIPSSCDVTRRNILGLLLLFRPQESVGPLRSECVFPKTPTLRAQGATPVTARLAVPVGLGLHQRLVISPWASVPHGTGP